MCKKREKKAASSIPAPLESLSLSVSLSLSLCVCVCNCRGSNGCTVTSSTVKNLGVILDSNLSFENHISNVLRPCVILARLLVAVFFQESVGDRTPLLPVHHLIKERIKHWTQTLLLTSSRGLTASGGVTSFANLYLFTAHTNLFCSPFGC